MYWTLELATKLEDAPWPATKDELIDYAMRSGAPMELIENLQEIDDDGEIYAYGKSTNDSSFAPLDRYMYDYGCTEIQYKNKETGKYETL